MYKSILSLTVLSLALFGGVAWSGAAPKTADCTPAAGAALYEPCASCHGLEGKGIAGKSEGQLMSAMQNYQTGTFTDQKVLKMQGLLRNLSKEQLTDLAQHINKM